jgi:hypothetical protein
MSVELFHGAELTNRGPGFPQAFSIVAHDAGAAEEVRGTQAAKCTA